MTSHLRMPMRIYEANKMQPEDMDRGPQVRADLERLVQARCPAAEVLLHGSCLSGVGLRGCDVDMTILNSSVGLYTIAQQIRRSSTFSIIEEVYSARVPILILRHTATGSEVDVSLGGRSSVVMGHVMKALSELNPMLAPMIVVLKKWAKEQGLIWPKQRHLSCFVVALMVIFHQQVRAGMAALAPTSDTSEAEVRSLANGCQTLRCVVTDVTLRAQLRDFFDYFGSFDFRRHAIDVRSGRLTPRPMGWSRNDMAVIHPIEGRFGRNCAAFVYGRPLAMAQRAFRREATALPL